MKVISLTKLDGASLELLSNSVISLEAVSNGTRVSFSGANDYTETVIVVESVDYITRLSDNLFEYDTGKFASVDRIKYLGQGSQMIGYVPSNLRTNLSTQVLRERVNTANSRITVSVDDYGAAPDGVTNSTEFIQNCIDANPGATIRIGSSRNDVYLIDKDIEIPTNTTIILDGVLKSMDAEIRPLTSDLIEGAVNTLQVANADQYFKVGQRIVVTADDQPIAGGGAWKTQRVGSSNIITGLSSTTITCLYNFTEIANNQMLVSQNARVAKANSGLSIESVDGVIIYGNGLIDGNKDNQLNVVPNRCDFIGEDVAASTGIVFGGVDGLYIVGNIEVKDWPLHGISTASSVNTSNFSFNTVINGPTVRGVMSKSIAGLNLWDSTIRNVKALDGVEEGEIILYNSCVNVLIDDCTARGNRRYGIAITGVDNKNIVVNNCRVISDKLKPTVYNFYIQNQVSGIILNNLTTTAEEMDGTWSRSGTTCTVTTTVPHLLTNGQSIYVTVPGDVNAVVVGYKTITVTSSTTFTFTCLNAGSTTGVAIKYLGSVTDGSIIINSCRYVKAKNVLIYRHKLATTTFSITAGTPILATGYDINVDGLDIVDGNGLSTGRGIAIGNTDKAVISNFSIDSVNRVLSDGSGNTNILFKDGTITGATTLFETNNNSCLFNNVKGQYVFEATGLETIDSSDSSYYVSHGLNVTPRINDIVIEPVGDTGSNPLYIVPSSINSTTFKVLRAASGTSLQFKWEIKTNISNNIGVKTYSRNYSSDFSAGSDSWSGTRVTLTGNQDGISDGVTSFDDCLIAYASADNNTHEFSKAIAVNAKTNKLRMFYYIPSGQTAVNRFAVFANTFALTPIDYRFGGATVGAWTEASSADFLASSTSIVIRLYNNSNGTFIGANSPTDDRIYFKFIKDDYIP